MDQYRATVDTPISPIRNHLHAPVLPCSYLQNMKKRANLNGGEVPPINLLLQHRNLSSLKPIRVLQRLPSLERNFRSGRNYVPGWFLGRDWGQRR